MSNTIEKSPYFDLNRYVSQHIEGKTYFNRLVKVMKMHKEKNEWGAITAISGCLASACAYSVTFSYFCLEGAGRSLKETYVSLRDHGSLVQAIGDAGGWLSLPIFSFFTYVLKLKQLLREGEFAEVKQVCKDWYESIASGKTPLPNAEEICLEDLYLHMGSILDALAPQCLFYKSLIERKLITLEVVEALQENDKEKQPVPVSQMDLDMRLKSVFQAIHKEQKELFRFSRYLYRIGGSLKVIHHQYGMRQMIGNAISGVVMPVFLGMTCLFSFLGEIKLGEKVLGEKEDIVERGHFGEWPDNIVASASVAYVLNRDLLLKEEIHVVKSIFRCHLETLKEVPDLHNRLCEIANAEIQQLASLFFFSQPVVLDAFQRI